MKLDIKIQIYVKKKKKKIELIFKNWHDVFDLL